MNHHYIQFFTATILWWKPLLKPDKYKQIIIDTKIIVTYIPIAIFLKPDKYKQIIIDTLRFLTENNRVRVYGFVIMPNHIHLVWKVNENYLLKDVQRDFLKYTAQQIKFDLFLFG